MNEEEKKEFEKLLADGEHVIKDYVTKNGIKYPLTEWLTIAEYCKKFEIKDTQLVTNWIRRGIVPAENVVTIEE